MRRLGKRIVAITLAATMMGSLTPQAMTFLQNEVVYAAEVSENVYDGTGKDYTHKTSTGWKDELSYETFNENKPQVGENYRMTAKVKISVADYEKMNEDT